LSGVQRRARDRVAGDRNGVTGTSRVAPDRTNRERAVAEAQRVERDRDRRSGLVAGIARDAREGARIVGPRQRRDGNRYDYRDGSRSGYRSSSRVRIYNVFNYYPRSYFYRPYVFGYGPAGRGYFYFDLHYNSYVFHPRTAVRYVDYGTYGYPTGELRLQVHPRDAQVFVDGYYAGTVDDFDGVFQSLRLEDGDYEIEIVLPGYEPLIFDVRIFPGEKVTYRGELLPELP